MKNIVKLLWLLPMLALVGCSNDEPTMIVSDSENNETQLHVPLDEALKYADAYYANYNGDITRGVSERKIKSVEYLSAPLTRSEDLDTLVYLVNFDEGFAMLAADRRLKPVYAISDEGSLSLEDVEEHPVLGLFFASVKADIDESITESPNDLGGLIIPPITPPDHIEYHGPLLRKWNEQMGYSSPFNRYIPYTTSSNGYVASSAVALTQYLTYFKPFRELEGKEIHWDENFFASVDGRELVIDSMAWLMYVVGLPNYLNVDYNSQRYTQTIKVFDALENLNFTGIRWADSFKRSTITSSISGSKRSPVIVYSQYHTNEYSENITNPLLKEKHHYWIIDGYCLETIYAVAQGRDIMYHCVWGWGGTNNGYYYLNDNILGNELFELDSDCSYIRGCQYKPSDLICGWVPQ